MMMRILLLPCLLLLSLAAAAEESLDFDRSGFGKHPLPIWSELGEFESYAVRRVPAARAGDADALLALYLLASGEPVDMEDYDRARLHIDAWVGALPLSGDPGQARRDARRLFIGMHTEYLGTELSSTAMPTQYREEQSQLSKIFTNGEFNCISSSLLYVVAARKLELDAEGVILPSHAFVQVNFPNQVVEVETTSFNGFDIPHDEAYYAAESNVWFDERSLEPPTWEDYQNREILSPFDLGVFNMTNQHTAKERMPYRDRMRLAELRAHYAPWDESSHKSRLAYYYQEFVHLRETDDYATARRMYDSLGGYLAGLAERRFDDDEIPILLTAVQAQQADTLVRSGSQEEGLKLARELLQSRSFPREAQVVESHLFSVVSGYAVARAEGADYPGARVAFDALEVQCLQNKVCNSGLAQVYSAWAMHYVEDQNWERSADIYREYLLLDSSSKLSEYFTDNLERVYLNWASSEEWNGEWETALAVLNQCTQLLDKASECEAMLTELDAKRDSGLL